MKSHEVLGSGAGTYEQYYLQHRTSGLKVRNAHNLYLETLADLGPVGLLLLIAGLVTPLVAGIRARGEERSCRSPSAGSRPTCCTRAPTGTGR